MVRAALAALALLLPLAASAEKAEDPLRIHIPKGERVAPIDGYVALPITVENGDVVPRRVDLHFVNRPWSTVDRRIEVDPGERRTVFVPLPSSATYWRVEIDSGKETLSESLLLRPPSIAPLMIVGTAEHASACAGGTAWDKSHLKRDAGSPPSAPPGAALVSADELPDQLAGYVGYRGVLLLSSRFDALPAPQQRALEAYVATGGNLYLGRDEAIPAAGLPLANAAASERAVLSYGLGRLVRGDGAAACRALLEVLTLEGTPTSNAENASQRIVFTEHLLPGKSTHTDLLLAVGKAPTGAFALIVLLFAGIIGPGSFIVRRKYGPHALLAFIPGISLITCLGIAGYGLFHEGLFTLHHAPQSIALLDEPRHRAISATAAGWYPTLAPREVRFGAMEALITPVAGVANKGLHLDASDGISFRRGLFPSRTYREFVTLAVAPSRARLGLRSAGEGLRVENALGARILWGKARVGDRTCLIEDLADGAVAEVTRCDPPHAIPKGFEDRLARRTSTAAVERTVLAPLEEGEYVVFLERAIFAPTGGLEVRSSNELQLVRGRTR